MPPLKKVRLTSYLLLSLTDDSLVSQIPDGQIQAKAATVAAAAPVAQIADGQIQAPAAPAAPVTPVKQISDGQIQAPKVVPSPVAPVAATGTPIAAPYKNATSDVSFFTGAAPHVGPESAIFLVAVAAIAGLL